MSAIVITPAAIVAEARSWQGVRWRHQGRSRQGIDCAGLVICTAHALGLSDFDTTAYDRVPDGTTLRALCDTHLRPVPLAQLQPADVLLMRFDVDPQHMAIVTDYPYGGPGVMGMVHAYATARKVVEHQLDAAWLARVVAAYRFPEVC